MNWIKRMLCAASAAVMLLTAQLTAFAAAPTYTKEEAWKAIQEVDPKLATRKYDVRCVDMNDLTTQDKQLIFDVYWGICVETNEFPQDTSYLLKDYFRTIDDSFYGGKTTHEYLESIYQYATQKGFDPTEAKASHPDLPAQTTTAAKDSLKPGNQKDVQPVKTSDDAAAAQETEATETAVTQTDTAEKESEGIPNWIIIVVGVVILGGAAFVVYKKQKS